MTVTELTDKLLASYAQTGGINHVDGVNLPSKSKIAQISCQLLRLLFPGFFDEKSIHSSELKIETAMLMDAVQGDLEDEVAKSIKHQPPGGKEVPDHRALAHQMTAEFLGALPELREVLKTDAEAAFNGDPASKSREEIIVAYPFIETIAVQRMAHLLYKADVALIPRIMSEWVHGRTGMDLHPGAKIGSHFFIDHGTGVVVGETTTIGNHVKLYHGVTLGAKSTSKVEELRGAKRHPTIEDHVTVYPGATILGGDTVIGEGSTIGGNVFLIKSIPPRSLVIYDPSDIRVLSKDNREEKKKSEFQI